MKKLLADKTPQVFRLNRVALFCLMIMLSGCSAVFFDNPMPVESAGIKSFNKNLVGHYSYNDSTLKTKGQVYYNARFYSVDSTKDSLKLIFADLSITQKKAYYSGETRSYYNILKVDTSAIVLQHPKEQKSYENNFIVFKGNFSDTLIDLNKKDELKFYKGKYYLNHCREEHEWEIYQLGFKKDSTLFIALTNDQDEHALNNYLINRNKILRNTVHLSDPEFYTFIQNGGFRTRYKFKKCN